MRIVAGRFKGRVLQAPPGRATRPTADRARQALFNILASAGPALEDTPVLDVFAGSGALGFEALSRGAPRAVFFESDAAAAAVIRANAAALGAEGRCLLLRADATRPPSRPGAEAPSRLLLLDPPYGSGLAGLALAALQAGGWIAPDALAVVEVAAAEPFAAPLAGQRVADERRYGAARLVFLRFGEE